MRKMTKKSKTWGNRSLNWKKSQKIKSWLIKYYEPHRPRRPTFGALHPTERQHTVTSQMDNLPKTYFWTTIGDHLL